jgi:hypothetical protein
MSLPSASDPTPILDGPYAASRSAWMAAKAETRAALEKMKASITKTRDPRAAQVTAALDQVIRRIPDAGCALEALADAELAESETGALKQHALKTAQLASYYLRSDRLVALVRENPFHPVSVDKLFTRALQTLQRELK